MACARKRSFSLAYNLPGYLMSNLRASTCPSLYSSTSREGSTSTLLASPTNSTSTEVAFIESGSSNSPAFAKWFLTAVLGVGAILYFKKSSLARAHCKEDIDPFSMRGRCNFIAEAVKKASPFVVHVDISKKIHKFCGSFPGRGAGSGFVVENGEYVLTNAHVVSGAVMVEVKLTTGEVVQGEVTDRDQDINLALIKLSLPHHMSIPPAVFVKAGTTLPGEWVVALGSPFALSNTITCGVVSTIGRLGKDLGLDKGDMDYIQTDASVSVGNSGGPLVNLDGDVIGINVMTAYPGISFAIPSERAEVFLRRANKKTGKSPKRGESRYAIGVLLQTLNQQSMGVMQSYYSLPQDVKRGILLLGVVEGRPADNSGLQKGDIIFKINGREVSRIMDLTVAINNGVQFSVEFFRRGKCMKCCVTPEHHVKFADFN